MRSHEELFFESGSLVTDREIRDHILLGKKTNGYSKTLGLEGDNIVIVDAEEKGDSNKIPYINGDEYLPNYVADSLSEISGVDDAKYSCPFTTESINQARLDIDVHRQIVGGYHTSSNSGYGLKHKSIPRVKPWFDPVTCDLLIRTSELPCGSIASIIFGIPDEFIDTEDAVIKLRNDVDYEVRESLLPLWLFHVNDFLNMKAVMWYIDSFQNDYDEFILSISRWSKTHPFPRNVGDYGDSNDFDVEPFFVDLREDAQYRYWLSMIARLAWLDNIRRICLPCCELLHDDGDENLILRSFFVSGEAINSTSRDKGNKCPLSVCLSEAILHKKYINLNGKFTSRDSTENTDPKKFRTEPKGAKNKSVTHMTDFYKTMLMNGTSLINSQSPDFKFHQQHRPLMDYLCLRFLGDHLQEPVEEKTNSKCDVVMEDIIVPELVRRGRGKGRARGRGRGSGRKVGGYLGKRGGGSSYDYKWNVTDENKESLVKYLRDAMTLRKYDTLPNGEKIRHVVPGEILLVAERDEKHFADPVGGLSLCDKIAIKKRSVYKRLSLALTHAQDMFMLFILHVDDTREFINANINVKNAGFLPGIFGVMHIGELPDLSNIHANIGYWDKDVRNQNETESNSQKKGGTKTGTRGAKSTKRSENSGKGVRKTYGNTKHTDVIDKMRDHIDELSIMKSAVIVSKSGVIIETVPDKTDDDDEIREEVKFVSPVSLVIDGSHTGNELGKNKSMPKSKGGKRVGEKRYTKILDEDPIDIEKEGSIKTIRTNPSTTIISRTSGELFRESDVVLQKLETIIKKIIFTPSKIRQFNQSVTGMLDVPCYGNESYIAKVVSKGSVEEIFDDTSKSIFATGKEKTLVKSETDIATKLFNESLDSLTMLWDILPNEDNEKNIDKILDADSGDEIEKDQIDLDELFGSDDEDDIIDSITDKEDEIDRICKKIESEISDKEEVENVKRQETISYCLFSTTRLKTVGRRLALCLTRIILVSLFGLYDFCGTSLSFIARREIYRWLIYDCPTVSELKEFLLHHKYTLTYPLRENHIFFVSKLSGLENVFVRLYDFYNIRRNVSESMDITRRYIERDVGITEGKITKYMDSSNARKHLEIIYTRFLEENYILSEAVRNEYDEFKLSHATPLFACFKRQQEVLLQIYLTRKHFVTKVIFLDKSGESMGRFFNYLLTPTTDLPKLEVTPVCFSPSMAGTQIDSLNDKEKQLELDVMKPRLAYSYLACFVSDLFYDFTVNKGARDELYTLFGMTETSERRLQFDRYIMNIVIQQLCSKDTCSQTSVNQFRLDYRACKKEDLLKIGEISLPCSHMIFGYIADVDILRKSQKIVEHILVGERDVVELQLDKILDMTSDKAKKWKKTCIKFLLNTLAAGLLGYKSLMNLEITCKCSPSKYTVMSASCKCLPNIIESISEDFSKNWFTTHLDFKAIMLSKKKNINIWLLGIEKFLYFSYIACLDYSYRPRLESFASNITSCCSVVSNLMRATRHIEKAMNVTESIALDIRRRFYISMYVYSYRKKKIRNMIRKALRYCGYEKEIQPIWLTKQFEVSYDTVLNIESSMEKMLSETNHRAPYNTILHLARHCPYDFFLVFDFYREIYRFQSVREYPLSIQITRLQIKNAHIVYNHVDVGEKLPAKVTTHYYCMRHLKFCSCLVGVRGGKNGKLNPSSVGPSKVAFDPVNREKYCAFFSPHTKYQGKQSDISHTFDSCDNVIEIPDKQLDGIDPMLDGNLHIIGDNLKIPKRIKRGINEKKCDGKELKYVNMLGKLFILGKVMYVLCPYCVHLMQITSTSMTEIGLWCGVCLIGQKELAKVNGIVWDDETQRPVDYVFPRKLGIYPLYWNPISVACIFCSMRGSETKPLVYCLLYNDLIHPRDLQREGSEEINDGRMGYYPVCRKHTKVYLSRTVSSTRMSDLFYLIYRLFSAFSTEDAIRYAIDPSCIFYNTGRVFVLGSMEATTLYSQAVYMRRRQLEHDILEKHGEDALEEYRRDQFPMDELYAHASTSKTRTNYIPTGLVESDVLAFAMSDKDPKIERMSNINSQGKITRKMRNNIQGGKKRKPRKLKVLNC